MTTTTTITGQSKLKMNEEKKAHIAIAPNPQIIFCMKRMEHPNLNYDNNRNNAIDNNAITSE